MANHKLNPPSWQKDAVPSARGWHHPKTGELLVSVKGGPDAYRDPIRPKAQIIDENPVAEPIIDEVVEEAIIDEVVEEEVVEEKPKKKGMFGRKKK